MVSNTTTYCLVLLDGTIDEETETAGGIKNGSRDEVGRRNGGGLRWLKRVEGCNGRG